MNSVAAWLAARALQLDLNQNCISDLFTQSGVCTVVRDVGESQFLSQLCKTMSRQTKVAGCSLPRPSNTPFAHSLKAYTVH